MKKLLLPAIAALLLLPLHNAAAKGKTYGEFKPNYKFTFKVEEVISAEASLLTGTSKKAKIPKGLPKYKKGQKVKFKIGRKGELIARGTKIPFLADGGTSNAYNKVTTGSKPKTDTATVFKANGKATGVALYYVRITGKAFSMKTYTLTYTLR